MNERSSADLEAEVDNIRSCTLSSSSRKMYDRSILSFINWFSLNNAQSVNTVLLEKLVGVEPTKDRKKSFPIF